MRGAIPPLPHTPSRRGAQLSAGQFYLYLNLLLCGGARISEFVLQLGYR